VKKFLATLFFISVFAVLILISANHVFADIEWKETNQMRLKVKPLAMAATLDGRFVYMLVEGHLLIYVIADGKFQYTIPIDPSFDMLTLSEANNLIILSSSSTKMVKFVEFSFLKKFDISGLPYKGQVDAPVTIITFMDYL
jgi:hypothetical protein